MPSKKVPAKAKARKKSQGYRALKLEKRIEKQLPGALQVHRATYNEAKEHWRSLARLSIVFTVLYLLLVNGLQSGIDIGALGDSLSSSGVGAVETSLRQVNELILLSGALGSERQGLLQLLFASIFLLSTLWFIRQLKSEDKAPGHSVKQALYFGPAQIVPFWLVMLVIALQLIPLFIASTISTVVSQEDLLASNLEGAAVAIVILGLMSISLYFVLPSIFALVIVSLPGSQPVASLKQAGLLVKYRRYGVLKHVLSLAIVWGVVLLSLLLPVVIFVPRVAEYALYGLSIMLSVYVVFYIYNLYRGLLK